DRGPLGERVEVGHVVDERVLERPRPAPLGVTALGPSGGRPLAGPVERLLGTGHRSASSGERCPATTQLPRRSAMPSPSSVLATESRVTRLSLPPSGASWS